MMAWRSSLPAVAATALLLLCYLTTAADDGGGLRLGYYSVSGRCPRAEEIVKEQVTQLYHKHGNTAVSWVRALFHDCMVNSCDASLLLDTTVVSFSEKASPRSFGMRNFKYLDVIKAALERAPPPSPAPTCSPLAARDSVAVSRNCFRPGASGTQLQNDELS